MINDSARYTKEGATFASGAEAYESKNLLYGPELTAAVDACYAKMLADGVLLEPITYSWDQGTTTLTVTKIISSKEAYTAAITFDTALAVQRSAEAGWVFVPAT
jgi:hypothetical protein